LESSGGASLDFVRESERESRGGSELGLTVAASTVARGKRARASHENAGDPELNFARFMPRRLRDARHPDRAPRCRLAGLYARSTEYTKAGLYDLNRNGISRRGRTHAEQAAQQQQEEQQQEEEEEQQRQQPNQHNSPSEQHQCSLVSPR